MTQDRALSILKTGANVFLTGEPGSGKSHTVNLFVAYLRDHGIEPAITASTGIAATHIGGMTIHSWSGIGIKKELTEQDVDELVQRERLVLRASRTHILIIDEISMLDARTLGAVDKALRALRRRDLPFGGMQVVFVGDFFQLPPVSRQGDPASEFAFTSQSWAGAKPIVCYLSEQHRQGDTKFLSFLTAVRNGKVTKDNHIALSERNILPDEDHIFTRLYSHNIDVDKVNHKKLEMIESTVKTFVMESRGSDGLILQLKKGCLSPENLSLKVGARVMFTKNDMERKFVNGTLGEVTSFEDGMPVVRVRNGREIVAENVEWAIMDGQRTLAKISQIPLRLAWAITVHKSQGMTLDGAVVDLSQAFEYGQGYVALSRVRAFSGLYLLGYNEKALEVHPKVLAVDGGFREKSSEAEEVFESMDKGELKTMEENFILACGGKVDASKVKKKKIHKPKTIGKTTYDETFELYKKGMSIEVMVKERDMVRGTIITHIEELFMRGAISPREVAKLIPETLMKEIPVIEKVFLELGTEKLAPVFLKLKKKYSYEDLRLARIYLLAFTTRAGR